MLTNSPRGEFLVPPEQDVPYPELVVPYQKAFGGSPWYEVSQCAANDDTPNRCRTGFSAQAIGEMCTRCHNSLSQVAYPPDELIGKFTQTVEDHQTVWYIERYGEDRTSSHIALGAVAWRSNVEGVSQHIYPDVPDMQQWLRATFGERAPMIWLDDVFCDTNVRPRGNLVNFEAMTRGMMIRLGLPYLAYLTINPIMTAVAERRFPETDTLVIPRGISEHGCDIKDMQLRVPDRRDFVVLTDGTQFDWLSGVRRSAQNWHSLNVQNINVGASR